MTRDLMTCLRVRSTSPLVRSRIWNLPLRALQWTRIIQEDSLKSASQTYGGKIPGTDIPTLAVQSGDILQYLRSLVCYTHSSRQSNMTRCVLHHTGRAGSPCNHRDLLPLVTDVRLRK